MWEGRGEWWEGILWPSDAGEVSSRGKGRGQVSSLEEEEIGTHAHMVIFLSNF